MGNTTTATSGTATTTGPMTAPPLAPAKSDVPEQCQAISDPEKQMHCAIDANNRDTFASKFTFDPASHIWAGALEYHPSLRGIGVTMEGAGNDKLGQVGGRAGGSIAVSFTGAITPKLALTLGGQIGAGYEDAGTTKYVTGQLSSLAMLRYTPNEIMSYHLSAKANLRATGSWDEKKAANDVTLAKDVGAKLNADVTAASNAFTSGIQADVQGLGPDAQKRLNDALGPIFQNFPRSVLVTLAGAALNPATAQQQINALMQTLQTQITTAANTALGAAAFDFEAKLRLRASDFKTAVDSAFTNAISSASTAQNPAGGAFGANLEIRAGATFRIPLGHTPFYVKTGIEAYAQMPVVGNDTHTVMAYERDPTKTTFGIQPTVGVGYKPKTNTSYVEVTITPDLSLSGGHANRVQVPLMINAGLRF